MRRSCGSTAARLGRGVRDGGSLEPTMPVAAAAAVPRLHAVARQLYGESGGRSAAEAAEVRLPGEGGCATDPDSPAAAALAAAAAAAAAAGPSPSAAAAAARPRRALTEEQLLRFHSDGFLIVRGLVSATDVAALSERTDAIASRSVASVPTEKVQLDPPGAEVPLELGHTATTGVRKMYDLTMHDEEMLAHARRPAIVDVIEDLLGTTDIKLYGGSLPNSETCCHSALQFCRTQSSSFLPSR